MSEAQQGSQLNATDPLTGSSCCITPMIQLCCQLQHLCVFTAYEAWLAASCSPVLLTQFQTSHSLKPEGAAEVPAERH